MGYILTEAGKKKVDEKLPQGCNCSEIARESGLYRTTVSRIIDRNYGVRLGSLEDFFSYFDLKLEETDYQELKNNENTTTINTGESKQPQNTNPSQNPEVQKYVKRPLIEEQLYENLLFTNSILRIKAPKKMGKTILINQVLEQVKMKKKYQTVSISFQEADNSHLSELNELLRWLYANVSNQLNIKDKLELPPKLNEWDNLTKTFGSKMTCTNYFEKYLLQKLNNSLFLCLDNLELLFLNENIYQDFLGMLRSWNDKASRNSLWQKLRVVISYAPNTDTKINPNQSPFNIGTAIELPEFNLEEVQQLAEIYQLNLDNSQVRELMNMVEGHPYLVRLTIDSLKTRNDMTFEKILETAPTKDGIYHSPHLQEYLAILKQHSDLAEVFLSIIKGNYLGNIENHAIKTLINLGLVKYQDGKILVRCKLYRLYFENYLGDI
ncbi:AAA-like domain-containing protein [Hydrocoleum sp. CS-953]|uniref:AAA-like domain-containing protein n=1 Tax=Hydrocoleum sp. CS-953 TaxID=1671698 RepID=UPI00143D33C2|nr:AAA-like domain-containing protein [Hydrocoleum sp. CS-953]